MNKKQSSDSFRLLCETLPRNIAQNWWNFAHPIGAGPWAIQADFGCLCFVGLFYSYADTTPIEKSKTSCKGLWWLWLVRLDIPCPRPKGQLWDSWFVEWTKHSLQSMRQLLRIHYKPHCEFCRSPSTNPGRSVSAARLKSVSKNAFS